MTLKCTFPKKRLNSRGSGFVTQQGSPAKAAYALQAPTQLVQQEASVESRAGITAINYQQFPSCTSFHQRAFEDNSEHLSSLASPILQIISRRRLVFLFALRSSIYPMLVSHVITEALLDAISFVAHFALVGFLVGMEDLHVSLHISKLRKSDRWRTPEPLH